MEFLVRSGLSENKTDNVNIRNNGTATIKHLENAECLSLIDAIHGKKHFDRKLFCNIIVPLTPEKPEGQGATSGEPLPPPDSAGPSSTSVVKPLSPPHSAVPSSPSAVKPLPLPSKSSDSAFNAQDVVPKITSTSPTTSDPILDRFSNLIPELPSREELVRRHSHSSLNRTPPPGSLVAEILDIKYPSLALTASSIFSNIYEIQESLTDFNSCLDSSSSSEEEVDAIKGDNGFKTVNDKKREKKKKRKLKLTPGKEQFLKKQNIQTSHIK